MTYEERKIYRNRLVEYDHQNNLRQTLKYLCRMQKKYPLESEILNDLSRVNYNMGNVDKALLYSHQAIMKMPSDVSIIFNYGYALFGNREFSKAIIQFSKISQMDINQITYNNPLNGLRWAKMIYNESLLMIAICMLYQNRYDESVFYIEKHLVNRQRGIESAYRKSEVMVILNVARQKKYHPQYMGSLQGEQFQEQYNSIIKNSSSIEISEFLKSYLIKFPDDYYILTELSSIIVSSDKEEALKYSIKAFEIEPNDYLVKYNYAKVLIANGDNLLAIKLLRQILNADIDDIAYGIHGEGLKYAKHIINDSIYLIGISYLNCRKYKTAYKYLFKHLENRQKGIYSDFSRAQTLKKISTCIKNR